MNAEGKTAVGSLVAKGMGVILLVAGWGMTGQAPAGAETAPAARQDGKPEEGLEAGSPAQVTACQSVWTAEAWGRPACEKAAKLLGRNGFAVIRNPAEEKVFLDRLAEAGIKVEWAQHFRTRLWANYGKGLQVVCWRDARASTELRITGTQTVAGGLRVMLEVKEGPADRNPPAWKGYCAWIPRTDRLEVPGPGEGETWVADGKGGGVADGLQACLQVEKTQVNPGDDITLTMSLRNVQPAGGNPIVVWDNKYSNGYRADFYLVVPPDGQSRILRRPEQPGWDKNAPSQIEIQPGKSWTLAGIANDAIVKSFKSLGLDTSKKGIYTVIGYYEANGFQGDKADRARSFWGGLIATPPIDVAVGLEQFHKIEPDKIKLPTAAGTKEP